MSVRLLGRLAWCGVAAFASFAHSQDEKPERKQATMNDGAQKLRIPAREDDGPGGFVPGGFGPPGMGSEIKLVARFDKNGDGWLDKEERKVALEALKKEQGNRRGGFGPLGGPGGGFPFPPPGDGGPGGFPFPPPGMDFNDGPPQPKAKGDAGGAKPAPKDAAPGVEAQGKDRRREFGRGFGPRGMEMREPAKPGKKIALKDVAPSGNAALYDLGTLRTLFLEFDSDAWEQELTDFHGTDVEIPATLIVDGKKYSGVGIHFRGMSSYMAVPKGYKHSLNASVDFTDSKQRLMGRKTLNLLNSHEDPSHMGTVIYSAIANRYLPTPKANFVRVVVNGEDWGLYTNVEQFDKDFVQEHFKSGKGHRWKVRGSPMGRGGLEYLGDSPDSYRSIYEIKGGDDPKAWPKLIKLCKTLNEGPLETLEERLKPILDVDGALRFLAVENALVNCDGYWIRASDYSLVCDAMGIFHVIPHDMNEAFRAPGGPGMGPPPGMFGRGPGADGKGGAEKGPSGKGDFEKGKGGPGRRGMMFFSGPDGALRELDPLHGLDDKRKPLRSRLLSVPALRERYLAYVKQIAREELEAQKFAGFVAKCRTLIEPSIVDDAKKLSSTADFLWAVGTTGEKPKTTGFGMPSMSLLDFAVSRRKYLLAYDPSAVKPVVTKPTKEAK